MFSRGTHTSGFNCGNIPVRQQRKPTDGRRTAVIAGAGDGGVALQAGRGGRPLTVKLAVS